MPTRAVPLTHRTATSLFDPILGPAAAAAGDPLLTKADEITLFHLYAEGLAANIELDSGERIAAARKRELRRAAADGHAAWERIMRANVRLVIRMARRYAAVSQGMEDKDFFQEGMTGLQKAVERFDPDKGFKFSTYAMWWLRQAMNKARTANRSLIRVPSSTLDAEANLDEDDRQFTQATSRIDSLDALVSASDDSPTTKGDLMADNSSPEDAVVGDADRMHLIAALRQLPQREMALVAGHHGLVGDAKKLTDLSGDLGVSRQRTSVLYRRAIAKLAHPCMGLGDDPWRDQAACVGMPLTAFQMVDQQTKLVEGDTTCAWCPVAAECRHAAQTNQWLGHGVSFAGTLQIGRRRAA